MILGWLGTNARMFGISVLVFFIGLGIGNYIATRKAVEAATDAAYTYAAQREAAIGEAYAKATKEAAERVAAFQEKQAKADQLSHEVYQAGITEAAKAKMRAEQALVRERALLAKEKETTDGLRKVTEILASEKPADPGCVLSPRVRQALDYASGARDNPADGTAEAAAPGLLDGPGPVSPTLTCDELARGYVNLSEHDRMLVGWVLAWQKWAYEALR